MGWPLFYRRVNYVQWYRRAVRYGYLKFRPLIGRRGPKIGIRVDWDEERVYIKPVPYIGLAIIWDPDPKPRHD